MLFVFSYINIIIIRTLSNSVSLIVEDRQTKKKSSLEICRLLLHSGEHHENRNKDSIFTLIRLCYHLFNEACSKQRCIRYI